MKRLQQSGLYEELLTATLEAEIAERKRQDWKILTERAEDTIRPRFLAHHIYTLILRTLEGMPNNQSKQVDLVNKLIAVLGEHGTVEGEQVSGGDDLLLYEAQDHVGLGGGWLPRPNLPLRRTGLLVNGKRDAQIANEIVKEIPSADRIDLLCAFIRYSGLRLFKNELEARIKTGVQVRIIASVYTGTTEQRALDTLAKIGAQVKVSYDVTRTRLHAKAWLFHRNSGFHTAYIGSSNLTQTAQVDGLEWNVRVGAIENPEVIDRFQATFEQYWQEPEFEEYDPDRDGTRLHSALSGQGKPGSFPGDAQPLQLFDVAPKPHQSVALDALTSERSRGYWRNLVVAATGTGKTWVAAFDYRQARTTQSIDSLLFVAHRDEILQQSQRVFQLVLRDPDFGERLVGGERPHHGHHVFASIQSIQSRIQDIPPTGFDMVIVDEFHHAAATSYDRLLSQLQPKILLGLTATPERTDGQSILRWFDGRVAYESRLWDALDQGLLCPFHYFGISDDTDLSTVSFRRGKYALGELDKVLTGDHIRARRICQAIRDYVSDPSTMRALGFCAGVGHANFMANQFSEFQFRAIALSASSSPQERTEALRKLRHGELQIIFTVDLFNEGVDVPEVDTILLLRPTESATIFLQQLGRGLRWAEGKQVLTVLDFVGQVRREYRYDIRYQALLGGTRHQVKQAIEKDFPLLPPGCALKLDRKAKNTVLANLQQAVKGARLADELRALGPATRLRTFLEEAHIELEEVYANHRCFTQLRQQAGFRPETATLSQEESKAIGRLLHVDDLDRLALWQEIFTTDHSEPISRLRDQNYRLGLMLFSILGGSNTPIAEADRRIEQIRAATDLCQEYCDLMEILSDRIRTVSKPMSGSEPIPLASHATYTLGEVMAAYGRTTRNGTIHLPREGVVFDKETQTDLLFITLEKSDKDYAPTTRYDDYPVSPDLFHWESQNNTKADSTAGRRYIEHGNRGTNVILFVRERKKDQGRTVPYHCLGNARYQSHESECPMKVLWKLERPMPGWLYQAGKVVAG